MILIPYIHVIALFSISMFIIISQVICNVNFIGLIILIIIVLLILNYHSISLTYLSITLLNLMLSIHFLFFTTVKYLLWLYLNIFKI